jgi:hypothetical protein
LPALSCLGFFFSRPFFSWPLAIANTSLNHVHKRASLGALSLSKSNHFLI